MGDIRSTLLFIAAPNSFKPSDSCSCWLQVALPGTLDSVVEWPVEDSPRRTHLSVTGSSINAKRQRGQSLKAKSNLKVKSTSSRPHSSAVGRKLHDVKKTNSRRHCPCWSASIRPDMTNSSGINARPFFRSLASWLISPLRSEGPIWILGPTSCWILFNDQSAFSIYSFGDKWTMKFDSIDSVLVSYLTEWNDLDTLHRLFYF